MTQENDDKGFNLDKDYCADVAIKMLKKLDTHSELYALLSLLEHYPSPFKRGLMAMYIAMFNDKGHVRKDYICDLYQIDQELLDNMTKIVRMTK